MDQNTTNINDLPLDSNPPENRDLPERDLNLNMNRTIEPPQEKRVTFEKINKPSTNKLHEVNETNKIIILASLFFLLFSDLKIKSYILNILIGIFGSALKSTSGGISKLGLVLYSIVYGLALFILVHVLELAIGHLS